MSTPDQLADLIPLHALDALEADEGAAVERAVADDPALRDELDAFRAVAATLAEAFEPAPSTPSPGVWDRIAEEIHGEHPEAPPLASVSDLRSQRRWIRVVAAVSVAAVAVSIALGIRVVNLQGQIDDQTVEQAAADKALERGAVVVGLEAQEGYEGASATVVLGRDGLGYVVGDELAPLPDTRTYQLWAIVQEGDDVRVISAGVLGPDPSVFPFTAAGTVTGFAITEEVAGGVAVSEGSAVAVGMLDA
jgi:anti-sigma-K factor RskA